MLIGEWQTREALDRSCRKNPEKGEGNKRKKMDNLGCGIGVVVFGWLRHRRRDQGEAAEGLRNRIPRE